MSFSDAEAAAVETAIAAAGETVTYSRAAQSCTPTAAATRAEWISEGEDEVQIDRHELDFVMLSAAIDFGAGAVTPAPGDRIVRTVAGLTRTYEVRHPAGQQPWRWVDRGQTALRLHTKYLGT